MKTISPVELPKGWPLVIGYAYATSPDAVRLEYAEEGCWTVAARHPDVCNPNRRLLGGSTDIDEAIAYALTLVNGIGVEIDKRFSQPTAVKRMEELAAA